MRIPATISAIFFDLDGTLVDSGLNFKDLRQQLGWPENVDLLAYLAKLPCPQERAKAQQIIHEFEMVGAASATWMPGAKTLLDDLFNAGLATGIVTRNTRAAFDVCCHRLAIPPIEVITREDAPAKPDPTGLLDLAARLSVAPENAMYVGDYIYDLEAAKASGMYRCLYDPSGESVFAAQADICIRHFDELANHVADIVNTR
ncbi:N-acetylmuramic acid 6-phosphate phosphatase [Zhongshania aliphaticivorans]|uniref:N-acetylmuramic acid 6-phosphate phosphatase n=1 Tax=Zhongshania aliphaticivorans TaxID=1470434 RepID=A0A5S9N3P4_9GAMM|nr:HAD family hydrolase [Zhongshania aliphaticivorans]CAA0082926.1 N-acetylmuramic acid 6-phosphate phosphatase [Zhongshania aliphaticivorans]CAA0083870.1 N-acetylmuramic acid 6-phosphate phosphatase [Zhongshania aliphaticivorans]